MKLLKLLLVHGMMATVIYVICSPIYIVWYGLTENLSFPTRVAIILLGIVACRLVKPLSVLTGKDFKIV